MEPKTQTFESWCIVELMGHQRMAGFVTEQTIGGASFIRIDVPECEDQPGFTRLLSPASIYAINPTSEETARKAAQAYRPKPMEAWDVRRAFPQLQATPTLIDGGDPDNDDYRDEW